MSRPSPAAHGASSSSSAATRGPAVSRESPPGATIASGTRNDIDSIIGEPIP